MFSFSYSIEFYFFELFQAWEKAIEVCKELQIQYEQSFEYDHLSSLLVNQKILFNHLYFRCSLFS